MSFKHQSITLTALLWLRHCALESCNAENFCSPWSWRLCPKRPSTLTALIELHQPLCITFVVHPLTTIRHSAWVNAYTLKACTLIDWNSERLANSLSSRLKITYNYLFYATSCHTNCGCIRVGSFINCWKSPVEFLPFSLSGPLKGQYKWEAQDRCY